MSLCIVDTSVFIGFFRGKPLPLFESLVAENRVVLSRFVRLELMVGARKNERTRLDRVLSGLIALRDDPNQEVFLAAEQILEAIRPKGITVGAVDLLIAAQAQISGCPVFSLDKVFAKIASTKLINVV